MLRILHCLLLIPTFLIGMRQSSSQLRESFVTSSIDEVYPTDNPNIKYYSRFRVYSITTFIDDETSEHPKKYVARTISNYPNEGVKMTYSGTAERLNISCRISPYDAQGFFKQSIKDYKLPNKSVQELLLNKALLIARLKDSACKKN